MLGTFGALPRSVWAVLGTDSEFIRDAFAAFLASPNLKRQIFNFQNYFTSVCGGRPGGVPSIRLLSSPPSRPPSPPVAAAN